MTHVMPRDSSPPKRNLQVALRLQVARKVLGFEDNQLGFATAAGLKANTYNQYEMGVNYPDVDRAIMLCDAHGLSLDYIYRGKFEGLPHQLAQNIKAECARRDATQATDIKVVQVRRRARRIAQSA